MSRALLGRGDLREGEAVGFNALSTLDQRLHEVKMEKAMPRVRPRVVVFDEGMGRESSIAVFLPGSAERVGKEM